MSSFKDNVSGMRDNVQKGFDSAKPALEDAKVKSAPHLVTGGERTIAKAGEVKSRIAAKQAEVSSAPDADTAAKKATSGLLQLADAAADVATQAAAWVKDVGAKWGSDTDPVVQPRKELPEGDVPPPPPSNE